MGWLLSAQVLALEQLAEALCRRRPRRPLAVPLEPLAHALQARELRARGTPRKHVVEASMFAARPGPREK
eukprot:4568753-Lingulodinium_polyedra.AAC.1